MPFVTPMPTTSGRVITFAGLKECRTSPSIPVIQRNPMPTGTSDKNHARHAPKWMNTKIAMATSEYIAASSKLFS